MSDKNNKSEKPTTKPDIPNIGSTTHSTADKAKNAHVSTSPPPKVDKPIKK